MSDPVSFQQAGSLFLSYFLCFCCFMPCAIAAGGWKVTQAHACGIMASGKNKKYSRQSLAEVFQGEGSDKQGADDL